MPGTGRKRKQTPKAAAQSRAKRGALDEPATSMVPDGTEGPSGMDSPAGVDGPAGGARPAGADRPADLEASHQLGPDAAGIPLFQLPSLDLGCQALPSVHSHIGFHVTQTVKDKIIQGQYVELAALLDNTGQGVQTGHRLVVSGSGQITVAQQSARRISGIEEWSDAFLVYSSIFLAAHPHRIQEVLKYFSTIRLAAGRHSGQGWLSYDHQFRLRLGYNPTASFGIIDQELWLLCMGPSKLHTSDQGYKRCFDFNFSGSCNRNICPYKHICVNCSGSHPSIQCRRLPGPTSRPTRPAVPGFPIRQSFKPRVPTPRPRFGYQPR